MAECLVDAKNGISSADTENSAYVALEPRAEKETPAPPSQAGRG